MSVFFRLHCVILYECTEGGGCIGSCAYLDMRSMCYRPSPHIEPQLPIYLSTLCLPLGLEPSVTFSQYVVDLVLAADLRSSMTELDECQPC